MVSGHRIRRILLRQVLMNVWIFFSVADVVLHVVLKILIVLILMLMIRLGEA